jgi:ribosomal protein L19E
VTKGTRIAVHAKTHEKEKRPARREGKHGARSPEQAIAIGLSKALRAGVKLKPPAKGKIALSGAGAFACQLFSHNFS